MIPKETANGRDAAVRAHRYRPMAVLLEIFGAFTNYPPSLLLYILSA
jgi:hypothetical protein